MKQLLAIIFVATTVIANTDDTINQYIGVVLSRYKALKNTIPEKVQQRIVSNEGPLANECFDKAFDTFKATTPEKLKKDGALSVWKDAFGQLSPEARNWCVECQLTSVALVRKIVNRYQDGVDIEETLEEVTPKLVKYIVKCALPIEKTALHRDQRARSLTPQEVDDTAKKIKIMAEQGLLFVINELFDVVEAYETTLNRLNDTLNESAKELDQDSAYDRED